MSYYTKITKVGLAAIAAAINDITKLPITYMAFGDGNGSVPEPNENATSLVNEVYRAGVNKVEVHSKNPNWLVCEAIIPSAVGGFNIREVGLFDNTGLKLLAIANYPPTYKPTTEEGAAKIQTIRIVLQVDNSENFELVIDPDIVLATTGYVQEQLKPEKLGFNENLSLEDKLNEQVFVEDYGAIGDGSYHPLSERFKTIEAAQIKYKKITELGLLTSLTQSIDWASIQEALLSHTKVFSRSKRYVSTDTLIGPRGGAMVGAGVDRWDTVFPTSPNNPTFNTYVKSDTNGTVIYYYGTGKKQYKQSYISSCQSSGGWREVDGKTFKLTSFYNRDATATQPATQKSYSVGFKIGTEFTLQDVRLCPYFDGMNGYNDTSLVTLADNWDVGIDTTGAWRYKLVNVQAVGYWRMTGILQSVGKIDDLLDGYLHGNNERGYFRNVIGQGKVGLAVRGYDIAKVISNTTNSLTIPWDEECFWHSGMGLQVYGNNNSFNIKYTGFNIDTTSRTLTFTGVTPALSGSIWELRPSEGTNGLSFTEHLDCYYTGLEHASGKRSDELGLDHGGPIEISGRGIRQPQFISTKFQTHETKAGHLHYCTNVRMLACQFEGKNGVSYLIASPFDDNKNSFTTNQRGSTDDLYLGAGSLISPSVNVAYFTPRGGMYDRGVFTTELIRDEDYPLLMQNWRKGPLKLRDDSGVERIIIPASDESINDPKLIGDHYELWATLTDLNVKYKLTTNYSLRRADNTTVFKLLQSGNAQFFGTVGPMADGTQNCGGGSSKWAGVYSTKYMFSSTVGAFHGAGSPEGVIAAGVGSTYTSSDNGDLYVKKSGSGNTGWILK